MALRTSELLLIFRGQNYLSSDIAKVSASLRGLGATADSVNMRASAVQEKIVASAARSAALQRSIANKTSMITANRGIMAFQAEQKALAFATARKGLAQDEINLANRQAAKLNQIAATQAGLQKRTTGSTAITQAIRRNNLEGQSLGLARQYRNIQQETEKLEDARYTKLARMQGLATKLTNAGYGNLVIPGQRGPGGAFALSDATRAERLSKLAADMSIGNMPAQWAKQYLAVSGELKTIDSQYAHIGGLQAQWDQKVEGLSLTQQKVLAQIREEGLTIGQINEKLSVQRAQLASIEAEMASIADQYAAISAAENVAQAQQSKQLASLKAQSDELGLINIQLKEEIALGERLTGVDLAQAAALDKQEASLARLISLQTRSRGVAAIGRTAQFAGIVGTAVFGGTAIMAAHFQQETTLAATQISNSLGGIKAANASVQKEILDLMNKFPATQQEQAAGVYSIFSSIPGLTGSGAAGIKQGYQLLNLANQAAVAGNTDLATSVDNLITGYNNFRFTGESTASMLNKLFAITKYGNVHFSDLNTILHNIGGQAQGANQSLTDLAGPIAELTLHMTPAQTGTSLARILQVMGRSNFTEGAKALGVNVTDASGKQLLPLMQILDNFVAKFGSLKQGGLELQNLLKEVTAASGKGIGNQGTAQAQRGIFVLVRNLTDAHRLGYEILKDNDELSRSYAAMSQTSGVRWQIFMNMMRATAIRVGTAVIPVFERIGGAIRSIVNWFNNLPGPVRTMITSFAAWAAIVLVVGGTLVHIVGTVNAMITGMRILSGTRALNEMQTAAEAGQLGMAGMVTETVAEQRALVGLNAELVATGSLTQRIAAYNGFATLETGAIAAGSAIAITAGKLARLRAGLFGLVSKAFVITVILSLIPGNKGGQAVLNSLGLGGLGNIPVAGGFFQQLARGVNAFNKEAGLGYVKGAGKPADKLLPYLIGHALRELTQSKNVPKKVHDLLMEDITSGDFQMNQGNLDSLEKLITKYHLAALPTRKAVRKQFHWTEKDLGVKAADWMPYYHRAQEMLLKAEKSANPMDYVKFNRYMDMIQKKFPKQWEAINQAIYSPTQPGPNDTTIGKMLNPKQFSSALNQLKKTYAVALKHPNNLSDWQTYYTALNKLTSESSNIQMQAAQKVLDAEAAALGKTSTAGNQWANLMQAQSNAVSAAATKAKDDVTKMVTRLQEVYNNFEQSNESMFGDLGSGRIMQGPIGQVFQQLAVWNIAPPMKLLLQDQQAQQADFETYRKNLATIAKRGGKEGKLLADELRGMGPTGRLIAKSLAGASEADYKKYMKGWQTKKSDITKATTIDYQGQLKEWESYGKKTMKAILTGMKSMTPTLKKGFTQYVLTDTLDASMRKWIMGEFPNIIKQAAAAALAKFEKTHATQLKHAHDKKTAADTAAGTKPPKRTTSSAVPSTTTNHNSYHYHQTVHAVHSESLSAAMRRARFEHEVGVRRSEVQRNNT